MGLTALLVRVAALAIGAMSGLAGCAPAGRVEKVEPQVHQVAGPGAADTSYFRSPAASIFRPLDLATPSAQRTGSGAPGPQYWQQQCDYKIDASLDEAAHTVRGKATITYTNNSPDQLEYIWLHLEQNLYKEGSLGRLAMGEDAGLGGAGDVTSGVSLEALEAGGESLKYVVYDTMARVQLPTPMRPGDRFTFDTRWSFQIPPNGSDRMGREDLEQGTLFLIAQWYPGVAVYDDVHGWNTLPYLSVGEFYFNFGSFDVTLTVPRSHIVASTGVLQNPADVLTPAQVTRLGIAAGTSRTTAIVTQDEVGTPGSRPAGDSPTLSWRFKAEKVRSFAWASSKAFIWDAAGAQGLSHPVLAQSFYPKEATKTWTKSTDMVRSSIEHYSKRWFEYPYPVASNINGPVPGMEYPMIIFCAAREDEKGLYGVTTHEIGHSWFPMIVNTDERRHAWMDEGFNSFMNYYAFKEYYDEESTEDAESAAAAGLRSQWAHMQPIATPADAIWNGRLGYLAYDRPATTMRLLREVVLGPERFDFAFREYIRRWAFKSPMPDDFYRTMEDASGMDLAWFWRGFFLEAGTLDQAVVGVEQATNGQSEGGQSDGGGEPVPGPHAAIHKNRALVTLQNNGTQVMPVRLRVTLDDQSTMDIELPAQIWATTNQWVTPVDTRGKRIVGAEIDPEHKLPDTERGNNAWGERP